MKTTASTADAGAGECTVRLTHHTSADTYDHAIPADLMQASAVIATVVYQVANRPDPLPRREPPGAGS